MSHERDAIARAFSRPFIEPPKRATAKRVGLTLAGIALLAAGGLIINKRQPREVRNGVECTTDRLVKVTITTEHTAVETNVWHS